MKNLQKKINTGVLTILENKNAMNMAISEFILKINNETLHEFCEKKDLIKGGEECLFIKEEALRNIKINDGRIFEILIKKIQNILSDKNNKNTIIYTNNLKILTLRVIERFKIMKKKKPEPEYLLIDEKFFYLKLKNGSGVILFKDINNFFGDNLKIDEKLEDKEETLKRILLNKNNKDLMDKFSIEMQKAIEILKDFTKKWIKNWEKKKNSIASISKGIYMEKFNNFNISIILENKINEEIRKSYFAGRDEIFGNQTSSEKILYFDFKSMHGNIMLENFWWGELEEIKNPESYDRAGFYLIEAYSDSSNYFPYLPTRIEKENGTEFCIYTNGEIKGWYTNEQIKYFLMSNPKNKITKILKSYAYKNQKPQKIFKEFAKTMMGGKDKREGLEKKLYKYTLNSLSGKFGIKENRKKTLILTEDQYYKIGKLSKNIESEAIYKRIGEEKKNYIFIINLELEEKKISNSRVDIAVFINSRSNTKLYKNIINLEKKKARVLAVKTDSIYVAVPENKEEDFTKKNFIDVKFEKNEITEVCFINPSTFGIKFKDKKEKISFYNKETDDISFEELKKASTQSFNEKIIKIKNNLINSYNKRKWKNLNRFSDPKIKIGERIL